MHELTEDKSEQEVTDLLAHETPARREGLVRVSVEEEKDVSACCVKET